MYHITYLDYVKILNYYGIQIPKNRSDIKKTAEDILSQKLCGCIKKVGLNNESRSIGICTRTVLNKKGLSRGKFKCKNGRTIKLKKVRKLNITSKKYK